MKRLLIDIYNTDIPSQGTPSTKEINLDKRFLSFNMNVTKIALRGAKTNSCIQAASVLPSSLVPLNESIITEISSASFLAALREEDTINNPETLYNNCYETLKILKSNHVLDKYVINDDEAAVICAIPLLLLLNNNKNENYSSVQRMFESCVGKTPSKLAVLFLIALRKLPRYRGTMYFKYESQLKIRRKKREVLQSSLCIASKEMNELSGKDTKLYREYFKIKNGWGYDISSFAAEKDEDGCYGINLFVSVIFCVIYDVGLPILLYSTLKSRRTHFY